MEGHNLKIRVLRLLPNLVSHSGAYALIGFVIASVAYFLLDHESSKLSVNIIATGFLTLSILCRLIQRSKSFKAFMQKHDPHYFRLIAEYQCGCSWTNDMWARNDDCGDKCPVHGRPIKSVIHILVPGKRPIHALTIPTSYSVKTSYAAMSVGGMVSARSKSYQPLLTGRNPHYFRLIAGYQCGCSWSNETWISNDDCDDNCPEHGRPIKSVLNLSVAGARPLKAQTMPSNILIHPYSRV